MRTSAPVESKVKASTAATFLVSLLVAVLNAVQADSRMLDPLPDWLQLAVVALVPPALTFAAGYQARHTHRGPSAT